MALRKLAERAPLTKLKLKGQWLLSPALFEGDIEFPHLREVEIECALFTYDGRWYYNGDPSTVQAKYPRTRVTHEFQEDSDSDLSLHSESEQGDRWDSFKDQFRDGENSKHIWRTKPDVQVFNPLIKALVAAILRMPNLQNMIFNIANGQEMAFVGMEMRGLSIEFAGAGTEAWHGMSQLRDNERLNRCYVKLRPQTRWDVPKDILSLCKEYVGDAGEVFVGTMRI